MCQIVQRHTRSRGSTWRTTHGAVHAHASLDPAPAGQSPSVCRRLRRCRWNRISCGCVCCVYYSRSTVSGRQTLRNVHQPPGRSPRQWQTRRSGRTTSQLPSLGMPWCQT